MSRNKETVLTIVCALILSILTSTGTYVYISNEVLPNKEEVYKGYYQESVEKCELLESVAQDAIVEGQGFALDKIDTENIGYTITPNGETIEFYYYVIDTYADSLYEYNATITLSKNYEIIEEEYSKSIATLPSEEEYVQNNIKSGNVTIPLMSICMGLMLAIGIIVIIRIAITVIAFFMQSKKER